MESAVKVGTLSSRRGDSTSNNISDPMSAEDHSDKGHKECVNQSEIGRDGSENHSCNALLEPQSLQELIRAEQNGCVTELSFGEGIYMFCFVLKI
jgi:hypothetical protein